METFALISQSVAAIATTIAAVAAWRAANTAKTSVGIQQKALNTSIEDYRFRERPRIAAVFRIDSSKGYLYLDVSNYGGPAVNVRLSRPVMAEPHPIKNSLNLLEQCVPFAHGIDVLRPGETLPLFVGDRIDERLRDDWALEKLAQAHNQHRPPLRYRVDVQYTDIFGEQLHSTLEALLDKTAELRGEGQQAHY